MSVPAERIERFLRDNPSGPLWVTVGFASAFGLAWLNERTQRRPVTLLIGDTRTGFANYSEDDRRAAIRFVQRSDVSVRNWYRKRGGHRTAHAKTWMVEPDPNAGTAGGILVGSANLTRQGLLQNVEILTLADPSEHRRLRAEIHKVMDESWAIEDRLFGLLGATRADQRGLETGYPSTRWDSGSTSRSRDRSAQTGLRQPRGGSQNPWKRELRRAELRRRVVMIAVGVVLLFVLFWIIGRGGDSVDPASGSPSPAAAPSPTPSGTRTVAPEEAPSLATAAVADPVPPQAVTPTPVVDEPPPVAGAPASVPAQPPGPAEADDPTTMPDALDHRPEIGLSEPPAGWTPYVGGNASTHGEPDRDDLQWVAWQPNCSSCEPGVTMTWVGSYASLFNGSVGAAGHLRPMLRSACLHRVRTGPRIDWMRNVAGDGVAELWVDGSSVPPGTWWTVAAPGVGGGQANLMIPDPEYFLTVIEGSREMSVVTADGLEATFVVEGFASTPIQANLDHCGHYP